MKTAHIVGIIVLLLITGVLVYAFTKNDDTMMKTDIERQSDNMMNSTDTMEDQQNAAMKDEEMMETDASMKGSIEVQ